MTDGHPVIKQVITGLYYGLIFMPLAVVVIMGLALLAVMVLAAVVLFLTFVGTEGFIWVTATGLGTITLTVAKCLAGVVLFLVSAYFLLCGFFWAKEEL
jgi:hypothetical protein